LLLTAGRPLSNKTAKRIFAGMGPLSSFSAKIEVAYMFEFIDKATCEDLRIIKDIRNAFAHTTRFVYFGSEHIVEKVRALTNWKAGVDSQECYRHRALECINRIKEEMDTLMYAKALKDEPLVAFDDVD
jgi:DNA-binding MltR family transcriptional regulator